MAAQFIQTSFRITIFTAALTLAGCASITSKHEALPQVGLTQLDLPAASAADLALWPQQGWWRSYHDDTLNQLIEQAFLGAPNLQVLGARVESADVLADGTRKLRWPTGGVKLALTGQQYSDNYIYPPGLGGTWQESGILAGNFAWDLDLWGKNRAKYKAALGQAAAAQFEYEAARLSIASNIVALHAQLSSIETRSDLLEQQIALTTQLKQRWTERERAGLQATQNSLQIDIALGQLSQLQASLNAQREIFRAQLATLIGQTPAQLPVIRATRQWSSVALPKTIPADILGKRADIAAMRHQIEASVQNVKAAKAEFYPNINLNINIGFQALGLDKLFKSSSQFGSVEPAISLPIFSGAALNSNLRMKQATLDASIAQYNQTVYQALSDAYQQLASHRESDVRLAQQQRILNSQAKLASLANARYKQGISPQMDALMTMSAELRERDNLEAAYAARRTAEAKLAASLGTGFDELMGNH
ncbi:MAG: efflux transporter outer membrane subunit [Formosimonas sp.]|jgi:NodT family efflux transporter outer membrane factor (OMF) lipoprotein